jgi:hypothetical protein
MNLRLPYTLVTTCPAVLPMMASAPGRGTTFMQDLLSFVQSHARDKRENLAGEVLALLLREDGGHSLSGNISPDLVVSVPMVALSAWPTSYGTPIVECEIGASEGMGTRTTCGK